MSRLEDLIQTLCPEGVGYVPLEQVLDYSQPTPYIVKSTLYDDAFDTPVLTAGASFILGYTDEDKGIYNASNEMPVIIFDDFTTSFHWVDFNFKVKSSAMKILTEAKQKNAVLRYVFYAMQCITYQPSQHARQWIQTYSKIQIPLPPLPVQEEIVRILDTFTSTVAELEAELAARVRQYEHYWNLLFNFEEHRKVKIQWLTLTEIAEIGTGSSNTNEELVEGNYPFFVRSQEVRKKNTFEFDETAIITSGDGVGVGKIFHYIEGKYALHQRAYRIHITNKGVLPRYYFYYMKTAFLPYIERNSFHSSVTSIRRPMLEIFPVPVPSLEIQEEIVSFLDRFDALVNDLKSGLPAEIALRRKQYEYYRDKLLTFPQPKQPPLKRGSASAATGGGGILTTNQIPERNERE